MTARSILEAIYSAANPEKLKPDAPPFRARQELRRKRTGLLRINHGKCDALCVRRVANGPTPRPVDTCREQCVHRQFRLRIAR